MLSIRQQLISCLPLFVKTIMANVAPITWLFYFQPTWGIHFDGPAFWIAYGILSVVVAGGMWFTNNSTPDPTYVSTTEISAPWTGVVSAVFQPLIFLVVIVVYMSIADL